MAQWEAFVADGKMACIPLSGVELKPIWMDIDSMYAVLCR